MEGFKDVLIQGGLAVTIIYIVLSNIVPALRRNGNGKHDLAKDTAELLHLTKDLHEWHSREDNSGRKLWYTPTEAIDDLSKTVENLSRVVAALEKEIKK